MGTSIIHAQDFTSTTYQKTFTLEGKVLEATTYTPISRVNIEITGKGYTTTNNQGAFFISAAIGDELVVRSDNFKTVYYTIKDERDITVLVEKEEPSISSPILTKRGQISSFNNYIDSAKILLNKDAKKSIDYVTKALESTSSKKITNQQNALAFETLGDINLQWQQIDLAINNFKQSNKYFYKINTQIKLAYAYFKNKNHQEAIATYKNLLPNKSLSSSQKIEILEGLGDVFSATNKPNESIKQYEEALLLAKQKSLASKITNLNSKLATVYSQKGSITKAETYFDNALNLSKNENKKRAAEEKNKVADFYNKNLNYDKEIQLRQEAINDIETLIIPQENKLNTDEALTPQRQNYKIANAFILQNKIQQAIPYLEKSINQAALNKDLTVQKDATRKLSEVYKNLGNFNKATDTYQDYVEIIDQLYILKEQELSQASRFSKEIALKQNRIYSLETERSLIESRIELAEENQTLSQRNSTIQKWIIVSLMALALLLLFTAFTLNKNIKKQKLTNHLLALKSLRSQMNPHFIFNALNSVNTFIATNDELAANKYLSDFSLLMRAVLENSEEDFIPLEKEIELLQLYLKLEHFRFQDKFDYQLNVQEDIEVSAYKIPPMLLQPYIENAVWHGLRYKEHKGYLKVNFKKVNSHSILIVIEDNGIGRAKSQHLKTNHQKKQHSKGMGNISERIAILNQMYPSKISVTITDLEPVNNPEIDTGTKVQIVLKK